MAPAAFWRAWSIWAVSVAATTTGLGYTAVHPLPAKLASGNELDVVVVVVFVTAFATVGALLAWKRPGNPIGWLLSATGLTYAMGAFGGLLLHFIRR
jgi:two-component system, NarL family, sensor kinase